MPLHAQVVCIGGNALFALIFLIGATESFGKGDSGLTVFLAVLGIAAIYTAWVLMKFRKYLGAEEAMERELHIERMREEIDQLKANNKPEGS